ncbi:unnamed protein product [Amoebophrya sp. A25]|nr:unnamed protein product [Amoebophrya sp. A25]|eukprot:GSA25T00024488001.1
MADENKDNDAAVADAPTLLKPEDLLDDDALVAAANAQAEAAREKKVVRGRKKGGAFGSPSTGGIDTVVKIRSIDSAGSSASAGGRGVMLQRSSMEDAVHNHVRVMFMLQLAAPLYAFPVLLYVVMRNLVHCEHEYVDRAIPGFLWHALVEYGFFWWFCPVFSVMGLVYAFYPPEMRIPLKWRASVAAFVFIFIVGGVYVTLSKSTNADPSSRMSLVRMVAGMSVVLGQYCFIRLVLRWRRKSEQKSSDEPLREYTVRERNLRWWNLKFGIVFFVGFYGGLLFADVFFPALVEKMKEVTEDKGTTGVVIQSIFEMLMATFFFSLYLPFWGKHVCKIAQDILMQYYDNGEKNTVVYERMQYTMNFLLDLIRFVYGRGVLFNLSRVEVFALLIVKDILYQFWHFAFKYSELYMIFVLKLSDPNAVEGLPHIYQVIARYFHLYNAAARFTEDFVRFLGIPKSLAVCWEETVDYNDHLGVGEARETTSMRVRVVFNNYGITVVNLPSKLQNLFKSAAEKKREREAQSCASSLVSDGIFSKVGRLFGYGSGPEAGSGSMQLADQNRKLPGAGAAPGGRKRRASLSFDLGENEEDKAGIAAATNSASVSILAGSVSSGSPASSQRSPKSSPSGRSRRASLSFALEDDPMAAADSGPKPTEEEAPKGVEESKPKRKDSTRRTSIGHEMDIEEQDTSLGQHGLGALGISAAQHEILRKKGFAVFRDVVPITREEQELLAAAVGAYQWFVFLRYQNRASCKFFTSIIFIFAPLLASWTPTVDMAGYKGLDDSRYFLAGLTFLVVDILEWLIVTFVFQWRNTRDLHSKVDYCRQLLTKDFMTPFLLFTFSWTAGVFMFNTSWNAFHPARLAKRLFEIGVSRGASVPHQTDFSAANWSALNACTVKYEDDGNMWTSAGAANFAMTAGTINADCSGSAYLYPREETQSLNSFFYGFIFDHCK